jgi:hypothetical protein
MLDWLLENKEWLFSGIGVAVLGGIGFVALCLSKRKAFRSNPNPDRKIHKNDEGSFSQGELDQLRKAAHNFPLSILVWGPSEDGGDEKEYNARCDIRDKLIERGHDAKFSEDLCNHENALDDPIDDEKLQAEVADVIIMIYKSRGTQTEVDRILHSRREIAQKTIILVDERVQSSINSSLSGKSWLKLSSEVNEVITYSKLPLDKSIIDEIYNLMEKKRQTEYVKYVYNRKPF